MSERQVRAGALAAGLFRQRGQRASRKPRGRYELPPRLFLAQAAAAIAGGAAIGATLPLPGSAQDATSRLLTLEKQIFEAYDAAAAYKDDIMRCMTAWRDGLLKLEEEAETGVCTLDKAERWEAMSNTFATEIAEQNRLTGFQEPH